MGYKYYLDRFNGELSALKKNNPGMDLSECKPYTLCEFMNRCSQDKMFKVQWFYQV